MFDEHDSIIGEHELVHVDEHDCCTWTVTRPCVPRGAITHPYTIQGAAIQGSYLGHFGGYLGHFGGYLGHFGG